MITPGCERVELGSDAPLVSELIDKGLPDIIIPTNLIASELSESGTCTNERLGELFNLCGTVGAGVLDKFAAEARNNGEYYLMLGQFAIDFCMTFLIEYKELRDIVAMNAMFDSMEEK